MFCLHNSGWKREYGYAMAVPKPTGKMQSVGVKWIKGHTTIFHTFYK